MSTKMIFYSEIQRKYRPKKHYTPILKMGKDFLSHTPLKKVRFLFKVPVDKEGTMFVLVIQK